MMHNLMQPRLTTDQGSTDQDQQNLKNLTVRGPATDNIYLYDVQNLLNRPHQIPNTNKTLNF